jgi:16S rRNA C967 or C1407 C5-methylase (RsmB/RsmF family)
MPKTLRINSLQTTLDQIEQEFDNLGFKFSRDPTTDIETMYLDEDFPELIVVPSIYFGELKASPLVTEGRLIFQDKASMYAPKHLVHSLASTYPKAEIIDARSGCGNRTSYLSQLTKSRVYAFEGRPTRVESLRNHLSINSAENVEIVPNAFITSQSRDFPNVGAIIVEPPSSGSAVMDRLGFLLQEEEFPSQQYTNKDLLSLKRTQISYLKHAFSFPSVEHIVYVTRSTSEVENQQVVNEVLERNGVDWELQCVMPGIVQETGAGESGYCLNIPPSEEYGNGIFVAHFMKKNIPVREEEVEEVASDAEQEHVEEVGGETVRGTRRRETIVTSAGKTIKKKLKLTKVAFFYLILRLKQDLSLDSRH